MTHKEAQFYQKFPFIDSNELDPYFGTGFNDAIVNKKEFALEKLERIEPFPVNPGEYLHHQRYIARYLSIYDELLLFHEPGTGKTCTAVASIEALRYAEDKTIKRAIICAKGEGLTKNFLQEFIFTCTDGRYVPEDYDQLTDIQRGIKLKKTASVFYSFKTFETFARDLSKMKDNYIREMFEDTIFVLDEVHNIREHDTIDEGDDNIREETVFKHVKPINIYDQFHRLFHVLTRRKIILMSGTPIKDTPDEFGSLMNLILPLDKQLDVKNFIKTYFNKEQTSLSKKQELSDAIKGRVSYLNSAKTSVIKRFIGDTIGNLKHFVVYGSEMSAFQSKAYAEAYNEDKISKSIFINSRQASLFVYPDGSYGSKGYTKYVINKRELTQLLRGIKTISDLYEFSTLYAQILKIILSESKSKHFIYCQYVGGSGAIILGKILENFGFSKAEGKEKTKGLRYALCTRHDSTPKQIQKLVNRFNDEDNIDGEYISVIIGSRVLNEGFTLKNVRNEFIITGHWNYSEVMQAIARGWRFGSHNDMIERGDTDIHVNVYQCVALPSNNPSIDLELYETAEKKDLVNRLIERLVKETAFDCALTKDRNKISGYDGQRECDYQSCDYKCDGTIGSVLDLSTYDLLPDIQIAAHNDVLEKLKNVMASNIVYSITKLVSDFKDKYSLNLIIESLSKIIREANIFYNSHGFPNFLGVKNDELFLTEYPESVGYFNEYYSKSNILETTGTSFNTIVSEMYSKALPDLVSQLFRYKKLSKKLLVELPNNVQRIILQGCLLAEKFNLDKNKEIRDIILDFYKGFYGMRSGKLTIWLYSSEIGAVCYQESVKDFSACKVEQAEKTATIKASPIGWYGLYNPSSNDFCLRNIEKKDVRKQELTEVDLRKVTVGKRCVNYDRSKLVDIAVDKMNIDNRENLNLKNKKELCEDIKEWFTSEGLLETNFDCGTSKKKRNKFAP